MLLGHPYGTLQAKDYRRFKPRLWRSVRQAYASLAQEHAIMVLEGAGSPAEINLRKTDLVNMRMAAYANAKVILVADIDRGGAFAALSGTMQLLTAKDRSRVAGFILNKFRGEAKLLAPALRRITALTGKPFLGVMPYLPDLRLPDEDSVSFFAQKHVAKATPNSLDIALVRLPHISNCTDFDALSIEPDVKVRLVQTCEDLGEPHCLILPGTRNASADLAYLRKTNLATAIKDYAKKCLDLGQGFILGICGGMQILGHSILDPLSLEQGSIAQGLDILPLKTQLFTKKILRRTICQTLPKFTELMTPVAAYEIHHGLTIALDPTLIPVIEDAEHVNQAYGRLDKQQNVRIVGTYLHGLFDNDIFRNVFLNKLRKENSLKQLPVQKFEMRSELDRLADTFTNMISVEQLLSQLHIKL